MKQQKAEMTLTTQYQVRELLIEVNGMTKAQANYKVQGTDEDTLNVWLNELMAEKENMAERKKNNELDLARSTFRKINTINDMKDWLIYIIEQTNIDRNTPIKMYSDEEGNAVNGILSLEYQDIGLVIIPLEE